MAAHSNKPTNGLNTGFTSERFARQTAATLELNRFTCAPIIKSSKHEALSPLSFVEEKGGCGEAIIECNMILSHTYPPPHCVCNASGFAKCR